MWGWMYDVVTSFKYTWMMWQHVLWRVGDGFHKGWPPLTLFPPQLIQKAVGHNFDLVLLPLSPIVPSEENGQGQEGKSKDCPKESIHKAEIRVKDVADSVNWCTTCVILSCLRQPLFPWFGLHCLLFWVQRPDWILGNSGQEILARWGCAIFCKDLSLVNYQFVTLVSIFWALSPFSLNVWGRLYG